jgi:hypothetical protein
LSQRKNESLERSIRDLFEGVSLNQTAVKDIKIDSTPTGIVNVQLQGEYQVIGSLQFPPGWHQHEFEVTVTNSGTIRHCKRCGQSSRLFHSGKEYWWKDIGESSPSMIEDEDSAEDEDSIPAVWSGS